MTVNSFKHANELWLPQRTSVMRCNVVWIESNFPKAQERWPSLLQRIRCPYTHRREPSNQKPANSIHLLRQERQLGSEIMNVKGIRKNLMFLSKKFLYRWSQNEKFNSLLNVNAWLAIAVLRFWFCVHSFASSSAH